MLQTTDPAADTPMDTAMESTAMPLIAHIVYRFDIGGMENGLVNLLNRLPRDRYRHAVICLTGYTAFRDRVQRGDVAWHALNAPPGIRPDVHWRVARLLRRLRPAAVHTRNLAAQECQFAAMLAGVPVRIHGEHGRDVRDLDGSNRRFRFWRRCLRPFIHRYVSVSRDLADYLRRDIGVPSERITQIYNGVDTERFHPGARGRVELPWPGFDAPDRFVIGTVGRMQAVKDPVTLARAFVLLRQQHPEHKTRLRLVIAGDGPLRREVHAVLADGGALEAAWLPGSRDDIPEVLRGLDLFVLPSLGEGVPNTLLEAMATGLPAVATDVGGSRELTVPGSTGALVPPGDPEALADAIRAYADHPARAREHGSNARERACALYSIDAMVDAYADFYDSVLKPSAGSPAAADSGAVPGTRNR